MKNRLQTTRPLAIFVSEDWRSQYLPSNTTAAEEMEDFPTSNTPVVEKEIFESVEEPLDEKTVANLLEEGPESQLSVVLDNQQRLMMAIDQMNLVSMRKNTLKNLKIAFYVRLILL